MTTLLDIQLERVRREKERRAAEEADAARPKITSEQRAMVENRLPLHGGIGAMPSMEKSIAAEAKDSGFLGDVGIGALNAATQGEQLLGKVLPGGQILPNAARAVREKLGMAEELTPETTALMNREAGPGTVVGEIGITGGPAGFMENVAARGLASQIPKTFGPLAKALSEIAASSGGAAVGGGSQAAMMGNDVSTGATVGGIVQGLLSSVGKLGSKAFEKTPDAKALLAQDITPTAGGQMKGPVGGVYSIAETLSDMLGGKSTARPIQEGRNVLGEAAVPPRYMRGKVVQGRGSRHPAGTPNWFNDLDTNYVESYDSALKGVDVGGDDILRQVDKAINTPDFAITGEAGPKLYADVASRLKGVKNLTGKDWHDVKKVIAEARANAPKPLRPLYNRMNDAMHKALELGTNMNPQRLKVFTDTDKAYAHFLDAQKATTKGGSAGATPAVLEKTMISRNAEQPVARGAARGQEVIYPLARTTNPPANIPYLDRRLLGYGLQAMLAGGGGLVGGPLGVAGGLAIAPLAAKLFGSKVGVENLVGDAGWQKWVAEQLRKYQAGGTVAGAMTEGE